MQLATNTWSQKNEQRRKGWMTDNILQLMEKRRKMKNNEAIKTIKTFRDK